MTSSILASRSAISPSWAWVWSTTRVNKNARVCAEGPGQRPWSGLGIFERIWPRARSATPAGSPPSPTINARIIAPPETPSTRATRRSSVSGTAMRPCGCSAPPHTTRATVGCSSRAAGKTYLPGEVTVQGALHKAGGGFRIDHRLAQAEKYLSHSFVESPEMVNVYYGIAVTDEGAARRRLSPTTSRSLNRDHGFRLTTIGRLHRHGGERRAGQCVHHSHRQAGSDGALAGDRRPVVCMSGGTPPHGGSGLFLLPELFGQRAEPAVLAAAPSKPGDHAAGARSPVAACPRCREPPQPEGLNA